jgi:hypothetical protein
MGFLLPNQRLAPLLASQQQLELQQQQQQQQPWDLGKEDVVDLN